MKYHLSFPTKLDKITPLNDNIDVCLQLEDGRYFTLVFATPKNLELLMQKKDIHFIYPETPFLIVDELNEFNIRQVIEHLLNQNNSIIEFYGSDVN